MTAARIRAQFPTSDGFGYQLKGCCRPPFVWASYNISRYIGRHSSRENNVPYCSHYSSSNTVPIIQFHLYNSVRVRYCFWRVAPFFSVDACVRQKADEGLPSLDSRGLFLFSFSSSLSLSLHSFLVATNRRRLLGTELIQKRFTQRKRKTLSSRGHSNGLQRKFHGVPLLRC